MAAFAYTAINAQGFELSGEIHAPDFVAAREQLRLRGLLADRLEELPASGEELRKIRLEQLCLHKVAIALTPDDEEPFLARRTRWGCTTCPHSGQASVPGAVAFAAASMSTVARARVAPGRRTGTRPRGR